jgi:hypothetical protein
MSKKKAETAVFEQVDETAVSEPTQPRNIIGAAIDHITLAAQMLRSKGGKQAESCAYVAGQLDRWAAQLEKLDE